MATRFSFARRGLYPIGALVALIIIFLLSNGSTADGAFVAPATSRQIERRIERAPGLSRGRSRRLLATETESDAATETPSATESESESPSEEATQSGSPSQIEEATPTGSDSESASSTPEVTPTGSDLESASGTPEPTFWESETPSTTVESTVSLTESASPSESISQSVEATASVTESTSESATVSESESITSTETSSSIEETASTTESESVTSSATISPSESPSSSESPSESITATISASETATSTVTESESVSITVSSSESESASVSETSSITPSETVSSTETSSSIEETASTTESESVTSSATISPSESPSSSESPSESITATISASETATSTVTESESVSITVSSSESESASVSETSSITSSETVTSTVSASETVTSTVSASETVSSTETSSSSVTASTTESKSVTSSATISPSESPSSSESPSESVTVTISPSESVSITVTQSVTETSSETSSASVTASETISPSTSESVSVTSSETPSETISSSVTETSSVTESSSVTATTSETASASSSVTGSSSETATTSPSESISATITSSVSETSSVTATVSVSPSDSETASVSASESESPSVSETGSITSSETVTSTVSASETVTSTVSASETVSSTETSSSSVTASTTESESVTSSATISPSESPSSSESPSESVTMTISPSESVSITVTQSVTETSSETSSASVTASETISPSTSESVSVTSSETPSETISSSVTETSSVTESSSVTATTSETASASSSVTGSSSETATTSPSESISATITSSVSETSSVTATVSVSPSDSETASVSASESESPSVSETGSVTSSETVTSTVSASETVSSTETSSSSVTASTTESESVTSSATISPSESPSSSESPSQSVTSSATTSPSSSSSVTATASITATVTPSSTPISFAASALGTGGSTAAGPLLLDEGGKARFRIQLSRRLEFPLTIVARYSNNAPAGSPLTNVVGGGFVFSDSNANTTRLVINATETSVDGELSSPRDDNIISGDFDFQLSFEALPFGTQLTSPPLIPSLTVSFKDRTAAGLFFGATNATSAAAQIASLNLTEASTGITSNLFVLPSARFMFPLALTFPALNFGDAFTALLHSASMNGTSNATAAPALPFPTLRGDSTLPLGGAASLAVTVPNDDFAISGASAGSTKRRYLLKVSAAQTLPTTLANSLPANHALKRAVESAWLPVEVEDDDFLAAALAFYSDAENSLLTSASAPNSAASSLVSLRASLRDNVVLVREGGATSAASNGVITPSSLPGSAASSLAASMAVLNLGLTRRPIGSLQVTLRGPADVSFILSNTTTSSSSFAVKDKAKGMLTLTLSSGEFVRGQAMRKILVLSEDDGIAQGRRRIRINATITGALATSAADGSTAATTEQDQIFVAGEVSRTFEIEDDDSEDVLRSFATTTGRFTLTETASGTAGTSSAAFDALEMLEPPAALATSKSFSIARGFSGQAVSASTASATFRLKSQPFKRPASNTTYVDPVNPPAGSVTLTFSSPAKQCAYPDRRSGLRPVRCTVDSDCATPRLEFASVNGAAVLATVNVPTVGGGKCETAPVLVFNPPSVVVTTTNWMTPVTVTIAATDDEVDNVGAGVLRGPAVAGGALLRAYGGLMVVSVTGDIATLSDQRLQELSLPVLVHDDDEAGIEVVAPGLPPNATGRISFEEKTGNTAQRYTVKLKTRPRGDVVVSPVVPTAFIGAMRVTPASLTFTATNYAQTQEFSFTVADNLVDEGEGKSDVIAHSLASAADATYNLLTSASLPSQAFTVINDDKAGVVVTGPALSIPLAERKLLLGAATFVSVYLATPPTAPVTLSITAALRNGPTGDFVRSVSILSGRAKVVPVGQTGSALTVASDDTLDTTAGPFLRTTLFLTFDSSNYAKPVIIPILPSKGSSAQISGTDLNLNVMLRVAVTSSADRQYSGLVVSPVDLGTSQNAVVAAAGRGSAPFNLDEGDSLQNGAVMKVYIDKSVFSATVDTKALTSVKIQGNCLLANGKISFTDYCFEGDTTCPAGATCDVPITVGAIAANAAFTATTPFVNLALAPKDDSIQRGTYFPVAIALLTTGGVELGRVQLEVRDNDGAALVVVKPTISTITEDGSVKATYTVALKTAPVSSVVITPIAVFEGAAAAMSGAGYGLVFNPSEVEMLPGDFAAKTITVSVKDDKKRNTVSGLIPIAFRHIQASLDSDYTGIDSASSGLVSLNVTDNDVAALLVCESVELATPLAPAGRNCQTSTSASARINITEAGSSRMLFVGLATDPSANAIDVRLTADHPIFFSTLTNTFVSLLDLSFTDVTADKLQSVTIGIANDGIDSGPRSGRIQVQTSYRAVAAAAGLSAAAFASSSASSGSAFTFNPEFDVLAPQTFNYAIQDDDKAMIQLQATAFSDSVAGLRSSPRTPVTNNSAVLLREGDFLSFSVRLGTPIPANRRVTVEVSSVVVASGNASPLPLIVAEADSAASLALSSASDATFGKLRRELTSASSSVSVVAYGRRNEFINADSRVQVRVAVLTGTSTADGAALTSDPGYLFAANTSSKDVAPVAEVVVVDINEQRLFASAFRASPAATSSLPASTVLGTSVAMMANPPDRALAFAADGTVSFFPLLRRFRTSDLAEAALAGRNNTVPTVYVVRRHQAFSPTAATAALLPLASTNFVVGLTALPLIASVSVNTTIPASNAAFVTVRSSQQSAAAASNAFAVVSVSRNAYQSGANFTAELTVSNSSSFNADAREIILRSSAPDWAGSVVRLAVFEVGPLLGVFPSGQSLPGWTSIASLPSSSLTLGASPFPVSHTRSINEGETKVFGFVLASEPADLVTVEYTLFTSSSAQTTVRFLTSEGKVNPSTTGTFTFGPTGTDTVAGSVSAWNTALSLTLQAVEDSFASQNEFVELCFKHSSAWPLYASGTVCTRINVVDNDSAGFSDLVVKGSCVLTKLNCALEGASGIVAFRLTSELREGLSLAIASNSTEVALPKPVLTLAPGATTVVIPFSIVDNSAFTPALRFASLSIVATPVKSSATALSSRDSAYAGQSLSVLLAITDDEISDPANNTIIAVASVPMLTDKSIPLIDGNSNLPGPAVTLTLRLTSKPTSPVTVELGNRDGSLSFSPPRVLFDAANTPQAVTVRAVSSKALDPQEPSKPLAKLELRSTSDDGAFNARETAVVFSRVASINKPGVRFLPDIQNAPIIENSDGGLGLETRLVLSSAPSDEVKVAITGALDLKQQTSTPLADDAGIRVEVFNGATMALDRILTAATVTSSNRVLTFTQENWSSGFLLRIVALNDTQADETLMNPSIYTLTATIDQATSLATEYRNAVAAMTSSVKVVGLDADALNAFRVVTSAFAMNGFRFALCESTITASCPGAAPSLTFMATGPSILALSTEASNPLPGLAIAAVDTNSTVSLSLNDDTLAREAVRRSLVKVTLTDDSIDSMVAPSIRTISFSVDLYDDDRPSLVLKRATTAISAFNQLSGQPPVVALRESYPANNPTLEHAFNVTLSAQPLGDVRVTITEGAVRPVIAALGADAADSTAPAIPLLLSAPSGTTSTDRSSVVLTFKPSDWAEGRVIFVGAAGNSIVDRAPRPSALQFAIEDLSTEGLFAFSPSAGWSPSFVATAARVEVANIDSANVRVVLPESAVGSLLTIDEAASSATRSTTVSYALTAQPKQPVVIRVSAPARGLAITSPALDASEATSFPNSVALTFGQADWNTPQAVSFAAVDNSVDPGVASVRYTISAAPDASKTTDTDYSNQITANNNNRPITVAVDVNDDDTAAVIISETRLDVDEQQDSPSSSKTFTVRLASQPQSGSGDGSTSVGLAFTWGTGVCRRNSDRAINVATSCANDADCPNTATVTFTCLQRNSTIRVDPPTLSFSSLDFATPKTVTVTALDDSLVEGDGQLTFIRTSVVRAATGDAVYAALSSIASITVGIRDNDIAGAVVKLPDNAYTPAGASAPAIPLSETPSSSFYRSVISVALSAQPIGPVVVTPVFDAMQVTVSPLALTFSSSDWNAARAVTITTVDDQIDEAKPHASSLTFVLASTADAAFDANAPSASALVPTVPLSIMDDDLAGIALSFGNRLTADDGKPLFVRTNAARRLTDDECLQQCSANRVTCAALGCLLFYEVAGVDALLFEGGSAEAKFGGDVITVVLTSRPASGTVTVRLPGFTPSASISSPERPATKCLPTSTEAVTFTTGTASLSSFEQLRLNATANGVAAFVFDQQNWDKPQTATVYAVDDRVVENRHTATISPVVTSSDPNYASASQLRKKSCDDSQSLLSSPHPELADTYARMASRTPDRYRAVATSASAGSVCLLAQASSATVVIREDALASLPSISSVKFSDDLTRLLVAFSAPVSLAAGGSDTPVFRFVDAPTATAITNADASACSLPPPKTPTTLQLYNAYFSENSAKLAGTVAPEVVFLSDTLARVSLPASGSLVNVNNVLAVVPGTLRGGGLEIATMLTSSIVAEPDRPVFPVVDLGGTLSVAACSGVTVSATLSGGGGRDFDMDLAVVAAVNENGVAVTDLTASNTNLAALYSRFTPVSAPATRARRVVIGDSDIPRGWRVQLRWTATNFLLRQGFGTKWLYKQDESGPELSLTRPSLTIFSNERLQMDVRTRFFKCTPSEADPPADKRELSLYWLDVSTSSPLDPFEDAYQGLFLNTAISTLPSNFDYTAAVTAKSLDFASRVSFPLPEGSNGKVLKTDNNGRRVVLPPYTLLGGRSYAFRVYAIRQANPKPFSFVEVAVTVNVPDPVAVIAGSAEETISISDTVSLDASGSFDPASVDLKPQGEVKFAWSCAPDKRANDATNILLTSTLSAPCGFALPPTSASAKMPLSVTNAKFVVDATYIFTVEYTVAGVRKSVASKKIKISSAKPLIVRTSLLNGLGATKDIIRLGSEARLTTSFELPPSENGVTAADVTGVTYRWSQRSGPPLPTSLFTSTPSDLFPLGATRPSFTVATASLPLSSAFTFCVFINAGMIYGSGTGCASFSTPTQPVLGEIKLNPTGDTSANAVLKAFNDTDISLPPLTVGAADITEVEWRWQSYNTSAEATAAASAVSTLSGAVPGGTLFDTRAPSDLSFTTKLLPQGFIVVAATAKTEFGSVSTAKSFTISAYAGQPSSLLNQTIAAARDGDATTTGASVAGTVDVYHKNKDKANKGGRRLQNVNVQTVRFISDEEALSLLQLMQTQVAQSIPAAGSSSTTTEAAVEGALLNLRDVVTSIASGRTAADWNGSSPSWGAIVSQALIDILSAYKASKITGGYLFPSARAVTAVNGISAALKGVNGMPNEVKNAADPLDGTRFLVASYCSWSAPFAHPIVATRTGYVLLASTSLSFLSNLDLKAPSSAPANVTVPEVAFGPSLTLQNTAGVPSASSTQLLFQLTAGVSTAASTAATSSNFGTVFPESGFGLKVFSQAADNAVAASTVLPSSSSASASTVIATFTFKRLCTTPAAPGKILVARYYDPTVGVSGTYKKDGLSVARDASGCPVVTVTSQLRSGEFQLFEVDQPRIELSASSVAVVENPTSSQRTATLTVTLRGELSGESSSVSVTASMPSGICVYSSSSSPVGVDPVDGSAVPNGSPSFKNPRYCNGGQNDCAGVDFRCVQMLATVEPLTPLTFTQAEITLNTGKPLTITAITDGVFDFVGFTNQARLTLSASSNGAFAGVTARATVNITDADSLSYSLTPALPSKIKEQDPAATYQVTLLSKPLATTRVLLSSGANAVLSLPAGSSSSAVEDGLLLSFPSFFDLAASGATASSSSFLLRAVNDKVQSPSTRSITVALSSWAGDQQFAASPSAVIDPAISAVPIEDDDKANVTVTRLPALSDSEPISESGGRFAFNVKLTSVPSSGSVVLLLSKPAAGQGEFTALIGESTTPVAFSSADGGWLLTLSGEAAMTAGVNVVLIARRDKLFSAANSVFTFTPTLRIVDTATTTPEYRAASLPTMDYAASIVVVKVQDKDDAGFVFNFKAGSPDGVSASTNGASVRFVASLKAPPFDADKQVALSISIVDNAANSAFGYTNPFALPSGAASATLVFTASNWQTEQEAVVSVDLARLPSQLALAYRENRYQIRASLVTDNTQTQTTNDQFYLDSSSNPGIPPQSLSIYFNSSGVPGARMDLTFNSTGAPSSTSVPLLVKGDPASTAVYTVKLRAQPGSSTTKTTFKLEVPPIATTFPAAALPRFSFAYRAALSTGAFTPLDSPYFSPATSAFDLPFADWNKGVELQVRADADEFAVGPTPGMNQSLAALAPGSFKLQLTSADPHFIAATPSLGANLTAVDRANVLPGINSLAFRKRQFIVDGFERPLEILSDWDYPILVINTSVRLFFALTVRPSNTLRVQLAVNDTSRAGFVVGGNIYDGYQTVDRQTIDIEPDAAWNQERPFEVAWIAGPDDGTQRNRTNILVNATAALKVPSSGNAFDRYNLLASPAPGSSSSSAGYRITDYTVRIGMDREPSASRTPSITATVSASTTVSPSVSPSNTVSPSVSPSNTASPSVSASVTQSSTVTPTRSASKTVSPTSSPSSSVTTTSSVSPTRSPSATVSPTASVSVTRSVSPTMTRSTTATPSPFIPVQLVKAAVQFGGIPETAVANPEACKAVVKTLEASMKLAISTTSKGDALDTRVYISELYNLNNGEVLYIRTNTNINNDEELAGGATAGPKSRRERLLQSVQLGVTLRARYLIYTLTPSSGASVVNVVNSQSSVLLNTLASTLAVSNPTIFQTVTTAVQEGAAATTITQRSPSDQQGTAGDASSTSSGLAIGLGVAGGMIVVVAIAGTAIYQYRRRRAMQADAASREAAKRAAQRSRKTLSLRVRSGFVGPAGPQSRSPSPSKVLPPGIKGEGVFAVTSPLRQASGVGFGGGGGVRRDYKQGPSPGSGRSFDRPLSPNNSSSSARGVLPIVNTPQQQQYIMEGQGQAQAQARGYGGLGAVEDFASPPSTSRDNSRGMGMGKSARSFGGSAASSSSSKMTLAYASSSSSFAFSSSSSAAVPHHRGGVVPPLPLQRALTAAQAQMSAGPIVFPSPSDRRLAAAGNSQAINVDDAEIRPRSTSPPFNRAASAFGPSSAMVQPLSPSSRSSSPFASGSPRQPHEGGAMPAAVAVDAFGSAPAAAAHLTHRAPKPRVTLRAHKGGAADGGPQALGGIGASALGSFSVASAVGATPRAMAAGVNAGSDRKAAGAFVNPLMASSRLLTTKRSNGANGGNAGAGPMVRIASNNPLSMALSSSSSSSAAADASVFASASSFRGPVGFGNHLGATAPSLAASGGSGGGGGGGSPKDDKESSASKIAKAVSGLALVQPKLGSSSSSSPSSLFASSSSLSLTSYSASASGSPPLSQRASARATLATPRAAANNNANAAAGSARSLTRQPTLSSNPAFGRL